MLFIPNARLTSSSLRRCLLNNCSGEARCLGSELLHSATSYEHGVKHVYDHPKAFQYCTRYTAPRRVIHRLSQEESKEQSM